MKEMNPLYDMVSYRHEAPERNQIDSIELNFFV